jgi:steroid 5-alpha reductase family enzyme
VNVNLFYTVSLSLGFASLLQLLLWLHSVRTRNAGWVDVGWSLGMGFASLLLLSPVPPSGRSVLVSILLGCWAFRLALHLLRDRLLGGKPEDSRYVNLRAHWGERANFKFFFFFQAQALLVGLFVIPAWIAAKRSGPFPDVFDLLGVLTAVIAVVGEAIADRQLARFRADPANKGKVCASGLWHYSRHPNYFFEWIHWMAYVLLSIGSPLWAFSWLGPVLMYVFLRYLTGIPHTERQSLRSRGEAYRVYQQTTSAFFPWTPRKPS